MYWQGDHERYRLATLEDLPAFIDLLSDPEVGRWLWFTPLPPEGIEGYFTPFLSEQARVVSAGEDPTTAVFVVESPEGEFLGQGAVVAVDGSPLGSEIGFQLCRSAWGRGVGTRLGRFVRAYAIHRCQAFRLEASCLEGNVSSRRILEGLGMKLEGVRPGYRLKEGTRHSELLFGTATASLDLERIREEGRAVGLLDG